MSRESKRLQFHEILCNILGTRNCYFSPPSNFQMNYPCIRYEFSGTTTVHADNKKYLVYDRYTCTYISTEPDDPATETIEGLDFCSIDRVYCSEGLNHSVFTINI